MKKHLTPLLLLSLGAILVGACASPNVGRRAEPILEGHFGDLDDFSGAPELNEAYFWGEQTTLDVRTRGSDWVIMAALTFEGRLGEGDLAPGSVVRVTGSETWDGYDYAVPAVSMLGCSGPADDDWYTDCTPDDIFVQIDEGTEDGTVTMTFEATFPDYCGPGGGGGPPPGVEPGEPPPGGSLPGEPLPPSTEPAEPPSAAQPSEPQVIRGAVEIALADILENSDGWGSEPQPDPFIDETGF